jgi:hypothetical protein
MKELMMLVGLILIVSIILIIVGNTMEKKDSKEEMETGKRISTGGVVLLVLSLVSVFIGIVLVKQTNSKQKKQHKNLLQDIGKTIMRMSSTPSTPQSKSKPKSKSRLPKSGSKKSSK